MGTAERPTERPDARESHGPGLPETMVSAVVERYGPPERVIELRTVPVPPLRPDEVLLRVGAASINAADWHFTTGLPMFSRAALGPRRPRRSRPGTDVAGTVVAVGSGVTGQAVGDRVLGQSRGGAFAEYVAMPSSAVVASPDNLDDAEAATLGVAALTALQALRDWGGLETGQRVLINGASGGVGTFAVQLARALGASHVTAVCSTRNLESARTLGADHVVDYTRQDAAAIGDRFDVVVDNAGVWSLRACRRLLTSTGTYVCVTAPKGRWLRPLPRMIANQLYFAIGRQHSAQKVATSDVDDIRELARLAQAGSITPVIERRWPLAEVAEALRVQGEFHARGKHVVVP